MLQTILQVEDLPKSLAFYANTLGFAVDRSGPSWAVVTGPGGAQLLLAAPGADLTGYEAVSRSGPGAWVYLHRPNLVELGEPVSTYPGYQQLQVTDPDGYVVTFWESLPLLDGEILAIYQTAPDRLEAALIGEIADVPWAPGKWTVGQIVHHIVDSDMQTFRVIQLALAMPGRQIQSDVWNPDDWMAGLQCDERDTGPALALFRAAHDWVMEAVRRLPDALDRWVSWPSGYRADVRQLMRQAGGHALHHIGQIEALPKRKLDKMQRVTLTTQIVRHRKSGPLEGLCESCGWPWDRQVDTEICPCCGFQPIYDVNPLHYRQKWLESGARWFGERAPLPWDLRAQLRRIGVEVGNG